MTVGLSEPALWLVAGLVLCGAEMVLPGVFLLWIGLAGIGTGAVTAALAPGWHAQLALFVALTVVLVGLAGWRVRRRPRRDQVNAPDAGLVGASCRAVLFQGPEGRVSLRDGAWAARTVDASSPEAGAALRVVGLDGTILLVARD